MSLSQVRVKLVVAAGVVGASLLAATFVGCQSSPTSQAQNGPYGQFNGGQNGNSQYGSNQPGGNQFAANPYGGGPNGQQAPSYGSSPQMASAGGTANGFPPQSQQAFLNETQRLGTQQNLNAQDVVAMSRSGVSDQQIAVAVQQRGAALRTTPGVSQYLAQNGVNPAVLGNGQSGGSVPSPYGAQTAMNDPPTPFGPNSLGGRPAFTNASPAPVTSAAYPTAQADSGQIQSAGYESSSATPAFDTSAPTANGAMTGQSWRAMPR
jgi:hypothetical protein